MTVIQEIEFISKVDPIHSLVVALLADGLEVDLVELGLDAHLLVARGAGKVVYAPRLVQRSEHVAGDYLRRVTKDHDNLLSFVTIIHVPILPIKSIAMDNSAQLGIFSQA